MYTDHTKVLVISMSDAGNGAENVMLMAAGAARAPMIFLKKAIKGNLTIPSGQAVQYVTDKYMFAGFLGLVSLLEPYRRGFVIISTHPYLNAYLGVLKRIGYLRSHLILRECTSVFTRYKGLKRLSYKIAYKLGYPAANLVVCQTHLMRDAFLQNIPFVGRHKVIVQENPVNLTQIRYKSELPVSDMEAHGSFICAAGRLIPEKGFNVLITAFGFIEKRYPGLKLLLFGEGPERPALQKMIETCKLDGRVILKGWNSNLMPYFKQAKVCIVSSIKEGFPNVLLEMMTLNPLVISTLCAGGIEDIPGIYKIKVNDASGLANAMTEALERPAPPGKTFIDQYLNHKTPEVFVGSLLKAL